jgi:hypothetical protein
LTSTETLRPEQRYNAALEHPTVGVAMRHLARKGAGFRPSALIEQLSRLKQFPDISVASLIGAAGSAGLALRGLAMDVGELHELPLPALAYLKRSSEPGSRVDLIQIESVGRTHIVVSSDRFGKTRLPRATVEARWAGVVLLAEPTQRPAAGPSELDAYRRQVEVIPDLISREECRQLIDYCEDACFSRSRIALPKGVKRDNIVAAKVRSSSSVVLRDREHPILARLYRECARREGVRPADIESIQCVRYRRAQRFRAHFDGGLGLPRLTTYLLYLNDGFVGGETYFPMLDHAVAPVAGSCLRFPSCDREGRVQWASEHGGLPVTEGVKYALNIWVRCPGVPVGRP